jgi:hypothetical protein
MVNLVIYYARSCHREVCCLESRRGNGVVDVESFDFVVLVGINVVFPFFEACHERVVAAEGLEVVEGEGEDFDLVRLIWLWVSVGRC